MISTFTTVSRTTTSRSTFEPARCSHSGYAGIGLGSVMLSSASQLDRSLNNVTWLLPTTVDTVSLLQFTSGVDCMIALLVGWLGGILAGMALSRARAHDEQVDTPTEPSWTPPATPIGDSSLDAFDDDPALTDEERILRLLASNDGRMKQSQIVDSTDWSKAKVSRLLSAMADRDEITKLTVGRENIIFLGATDEVYLSSDESES